MMQGKLSLLVIVLLTSLVAACGGGEETAELPPAPAVETVVESPVEEAVSPTEEPQPTAELPPTAEPQPTETLQPTGEPEAAEEASADSGEGWGASGTTAQSACDHPYFPLRTGANWTISAGSGDPIIWEVVHVEGDMQSATAEMQMTIGDLEFAYTWECSQNGALVSFGFGNQGLSALGPDVKIEVSEGSGMFLAPPEALVPGYSWDTSYHSVYSLTQIDGDLEMEVGGEMSTMQTSTVLSAEPVPFDDETVPGLLIQQDSQIDMIMSILDESVESSTSSGGEMVLGHGLGMLRQTSFTDFGDFTMETTEVFVP